MSENVGTCRKSLETVGKHTGKWLQYGSGVMVPERPRINVPLILLAAVWLRREQEIWQEQLDRLRELGISVQGFPL